MRNSLFIQVWGKNIYALRMRVDVCWSTTPCRLLSVYLPFITTPKRRCVLTRPHDFIAQETVRFIVTTYEPQISHLFRVSDTRLPKRFLELKEEKGLVGWRTLHEVQRQDIHRLRIIRMITLDAGLLARSQYSEGPATGHLDTGVSWFPCA